ncbi:prenyltransferase [Fibrobacterota bacterium]
MTNTTKQAIMGTMRIPFLVLTPACVVLGVAATAWSGKTLNLWYLILAAIGALAAHISVNALNEYFDFKSGLDFNTQKTPFSGGSGVLPSHPEKSHLGLITGLVAFAATGLIGIYFIFVWGWGILPLGLAGLAIIALYTTWITKNTFLCLVAPGLGFGPLMVMGTAFVLTGSYSMTAFIASLVPFFLVSNLLLLNQFPDVEPDKEIGRRHLPIAIGTRASAWIYAIFMACTYAAVIYGYLAGLFHWAGLLALGSAVLAFPTIRGVLKHSQSIPALIPYMGKNVVITIFTPVLLAIGLFLGRFLGA